MPRNLFVVGSLLVLISVGIGVWWSWSGATAPPAPPAATERADAGPARPAAAPLAPPPAPTATERSLAEAPPPATASAPAATEPTRRLRGTIVVVEADGREHRHCDGVMELVLAVPIGETSSSLHSVTIDVKDGAWEADAPATTQWLEVGTLTLDGRAAVSSEEIALPDDEATMALRARWQPTLRLRVLADDTGAELVGVTVLEIRGWPETDRAHPGHPRPKPLLQAARSPLEITPTTRDDELHLRVRADGYAWRPITLSTTASAERVLRLPPGGDVDVTFVGDLPGGATLRVRAGSAADSDRVADERPLAEYGLADARQLRVDALPVGDWSFSVEKGDWWDTRVVFGHTAVTVVAGTITPATIQLRSDATPLPAIAIRGTLTLPERWGKDVHLELEPTGANESWSDARIRIALDEMQALGGGRFAWGERQLLSGRWQALVDGTEHRAVFEVGPGHPTQIDLVVPEPCDVRVRVVDAETGLPIPDADPSFFALPETWSGGWGHTSMRRGDDDWYHCLAPPGRLTIHAHPDGYGWSHEEHDVRPGHNEIVIRIGRVQGIEITLMDGEAKVPWPNLGHARLEHTATKSGVAYWSGHRVASKEPGEHTLTIDRVDGFAPIPPRKVVIEPGRWTPVVIALERAK